MKIVRAHCPLIDEIDAVFHTRGRPIIYAWGDTIFAPEPNGQITPALDAHESVHGRRQLAHLGSMEGWWRAYLADPAFRLAEEIPAHQAEYAWHLKYAGGRGSRRRAFAEIASRLSGPLYGRMISRARAEALLQNAAEPVMHAM